jgi:hypothetical protein
MMYARLYDEAESARWRIADVPWRELRPDAVTPELVQLVRDIVASEATTFSATQRFLRDFADDVELTNWISVWFYEETKHPQVLMRWLDAVGASYDDEAVRRARVTAPFMKSKTATLTSNVISEMVAATRYMNLRGNSPEPVLSWIAARLAGDEARHAASFFSFAQRRILMSAEPDTERRDALKVLYLWANEREQMRHPVNMFQGSVGFEAAMSRVIRMIGLLVDLPLRTPDDVVCQLKDQPQAST